MVVLQLGEMYREPRDTRGLGDNRIVRVSTMRPHRCGSWILCGVLSD